MAFAEGKPEEGDQLLRKAVELGSRLVAVDVNPLFVLADGWLLVATRLLQTFEIRGMG